MPRRLRLTLAGVAVHLIQRGNNRGACFFADEDYVLACYRYVELNPMRAGMVRHPADYRWSSYRVNGHGTPSRLVVPHEEYLRLGTNATDRCEAYRALVGAQLDSGLVTEIRAATNGNIALGNERFRAEIEAALGRRARRGTPGRPLAQTKDRK